MASEPNLPDHEMEKLLKLEIFRRPMCLISSNGAGILSVEESAMSQLEEIDIGVNVVAIAGLYRTGKSYLMNRLAYVNSGFALGNTIESKTKGIWVWCRKHPTQGNQVLVLLDTEGLGDVMTGDIHHDNKIFTLAALLSSTLVYNMMGAFNQDAVEKLTFITEMSTNMKLTSGDEPGGDECFDFVLPRFVLCLRDFFLDLERDGKEITSDQYLDDCLESRPGDSREDITYNRPRECIKKYFIKRKVFTFDRPGGKRLMKKLETAHDDELSDDFKEDTMKFTSFVFQCEPKKLINKQIMRGSMLAKVAREYVKSMREGGVPCVDDAMTTMCRMENEKAVKEAVADFDEKMKALELPVYDCKIFQGNRYKLQAMLIKALNKRMLFDDNNEAEKTAEEEMEIIARAVEERNAKMLQDLCMEKLKELYKPIAGNMNELYKVSGGFQKYKKDMEAFEKSFNEKMSAVESAERMKAFNYFLSEIKNDAEEILEKDQQLSKEEKEKELEEKEKMAQNRIKESQELLSRQLEEQKLAHEKELERTREEQRKKDEANLNAAKNEWLAARSQSENSQLLNEMKKENKRLRAQRDRGVISKTWGYFFD